MSRNAVNRDVVQSLVPKRMGNVFPCNGCFNPTWLASNPSQQKARQRTVVRPKRCKDNCRSLAGDFDSLGQHLILIHKDRFYMVLLGTLWEEGIDPQPCMLLRPAGFSKLSKLNVFLSSSCFSLLRKNPLPFASQVKPITSSVKKPYTLYCIEQIVSHYKQFDHITWAYHRWLNGRPTRPTRYNNTINPWRRYSKWMEYTYI